MEERPNKQVVDYFMQVTGEKFDEVSSRLRRIEDKMEQLIGFRWMLIGMASAVSALTSIAFAIITRKP